jgi:hypothetical protein
MRSKRALKMKAHMYNHPKIGDWPPATGGSYGPGDVFPSPGEGKLHGVTFVDASRQTGSEHLRVVVEFRGRLSSGEIFAADPEDHQALPALLNELKKQIGKEMKDISSMEFDL